MAASLHFILHTFHNLCVLATFCSVVHTFCSLSFCSLVFQKKTTRLIALPRSTFHKSPFVPLQLCQCHAERGTTRMYICVCYTLPSQGVLPEFL
jgi:hypothetical protein